MPDVGRRKTTSDQPDDPGKPRSNRKRGAAIFTRLEQGLYDEFTAAVETLQPRTTAQAVVEMLIKRWLVDHGKPRTD
jgi:hypothetical protein